MAAPGISASEEGRRRAAGRVQPILHEERTGRSGRGTTMTEYSCRFDATLDSVHDARRFVGRHLSEFDGGIAADVVLMTSELATNAICHSGTGFEMSLMADPADGFIRVEVRDEGGGEVVRHVPGTYEGTGRGLQIVDQLADRWGWRPADDGPGKSVWFELNTHLSHGAGSPDVRRGGSHDMVVSDGPLPAEGVSGSRP